MFIVAIFTIAKTQKQSKCPSMEEWVHIYIHNMAYHSTIERMDKKEWYMYIMEYYSVIKKK